MARARYRSIRILLLLLVAALVTAILVGVIRHWLTNPAPGVEPMSQQILSLVGMPVVFAVGGLPALVSAWLLTRREPHLTLRRIVTIAAIANVASAIPGLVVLRMIIWDTSGWLFTLLSLAAIGFASFVLVLLLFREGTVVGRVDDSSGSQRS